MTVSSWQLLMLICYAAATAVPAPYPVEKYPTTGALVGPTSPEEDRSLPSPFAVVIMSQPGWHCSDIPAHGSLHPPGIWFSSCSLFHHHPWVLAATEPRSWPDLLICTPATELLPADTSSLCLYLPRDPFLPHVISRCRVLKISFGFPCNHPHASV